MRIRDFDALFFLFLQVFFFFRGYLRSTFYLLNKISDFENICRHYMDVRIICLFPMRKILDSMCPTFFSKIFYEWLYLIRSLSFFAYLFNQLPDGTLQGKTQKSIIPFWLMNSLKCNINLVYIPTHKETPLEIARFNLKAYL